MSPLRHLLVLFALANFAVVSLHAQTSSYRVLVSEGYEYSNSYNVSILMPFMGKWFVGR